MSSSLTLLVPQQHLQNHPTSAAPTRIDRVSSNLKSPCRIAIGTNQVNKQLAISLNRSPDVIEGLMNVECHNWIHVLKYCAKNGRLREVNGIHGLVVKSCFCNDKDYIVLLNHVVQAYLKCFDYEVACEVFKKMVMRNIFSWTLMIVGSTENERFSDGYEWFYDMLNDGVLPDAFVYSSVIQSCIGMGSVTLGEMVHAHALMTGYAGDDFVSSSLLNMYAKFGEIGYACKVFDSMGERSRVSWNSLISALTANGFHLEAYRHYMMLKNEGVEANMYTLVSVLKSVGMLGNSTVGKEIHRVAGKLDLESNVNVGTALIDMYCKCNLFLDAEALFKTYFIQCQKNVPWNAMISGYVQCGLYQEALDLYVRMFQNNVQQDSYTYCSIFNAIANLKCLRYLKELHCVVVRSGCYMNFTSVCNAVADAYSKCGSLENVRNVFKSMEVRDIVTWTILISACCVNSEEAEALSAFSQMRVEKVIANEFTFATVLVACATLCSLEYGRQLHSLIFKTGMHTKKCIESALVDMYAKCGNMCDAKRAFEMILDPDVVSWTAIISGYAQHGQAKDALEVFSMMEKSGTKPNAVTLLSIFCACSHGGMVEEGIRYFKNMEHTYGLVPEMEHYSCIVDLLGRYGRLDDAMSFISDIPFEPNEVIWQTLLSACRVHGNVRLAEFAAQKILSTNLNQSAPYILLSNTYAESGCTEDGLYMKRAMKKQGVKREAGYSWITVDGQVHKFYAGDQLHPRKAAIYNALDNLQDKMKG